jgi:putative hydrolase of the HAD superfamily
VSYRAVIFDVGGVLVGSPLDAIARFEREQGLPEGFVNRVVITRGLSGAWARLERGELTLEEFYPAFDRECLAAGHGLSTRDMMARIDEVTVPRPAFFEAIRRIRKNGLRTAALTNNWIRDGTENHELRALFDAFIESSVVGLRKPDPAIYRLACRKLEVQPQQAVFLDDIGANLKPARELGMTTIRVVDPDDALGELEAVLGFAMRG